MVCELLLNVADLLTASLTEDSRNELLAVASCSYRASKKHSKHAQIQ